ncbi:MAG: PVC-type heme-binding CxxCH protein [Phycisphaeraceae bacterium]
MQRRTLSWWTFAIAIVMLAIASPLLAADPAPSAPAPIRMLFLGDRGHHQPFARAQELVPVLKERGIDITYTEDLAALSKETLAKYDGLIIFANQTSIKPEQEKALIDFVENGGGFVPIHCASYCFLNSPKYIDLVGAQFQRHGTGIFRVTPTDAKSELVEALPVLESWDETYVHTKHNEKDRVVLQTRREGNKDEPWTWIRTQGKGRVFYTAWGHDHRTWRQPAFAELIERGIRWSVGQKPISYRPNVEPFQRREAVLPNYLPSDKWGVQGEPIRTMQLPVSPQQSMKHMVLPPGFKAELFASDPEILKPICMAWDERGRLWISETVDYPNEMQKEGEGRDRIRICEDTDGDGKADKFTIFADKLSIPTSIVHAHGGLIIAQAPDMLFLRDTDGDDKADERRVLFTGFSTNDTHAGPSNLRYGFDNWIYGVIGYAGYSGDVGGKKHNFRQGFFRFQISNFKSSDERIDLEFLRSSNNNTWGLGFTEDGLLVGSTANGTPSMYMPLANRYYESVRGWSAAVLNSIADSNYFYPVTDKVRQVDQHHKFTAAAGHAVYTARNYPREYWNRAAFVAEPTGHLIATFELERKGSDVLAKTSANLFASDDEWTSPIVAEVGPDGNVWIIDWYNYIVQHNPTPQGFKNGRGNAYETPERDKRHGRIYRLVYDAKLLNPATRDGLGRGETPAQPRTTGNATNARVGGSLVLPSGGSHSTEHLINLLKSDIMNTRLTAQRLLVERFRASRADMEDTVLKPLIALTQERALDAIGNTPGAMHAIWTLDGLGAFEGTSRDPALALAAALKHPAAPVRRAAILAGPRSADRMAGVLERLGDGDAHVRMAALQFLADMDSPSDRAGAAVYAMLQRPENSSDKWIGDAAISAAARHDAGFLRAVLASTESSGKVVDVPVVPKAKVTYPNLIANPSAETIENGQPAGWRKVTYAGSAEQTVVDGGRTGKKSFQIVSAKGTDASWTVEVNVTPNTNYQLSAWIKTKGVNKGTGFGAQLNVHQLQNPRIKTDGVTGDSDWTRVEVSFNSGGNNKLAINCLFGGWGQSTGTAWFDDLQLVQTDGPVSPGGSVASPVTGRVGEVISIVTRHYAQRAPVESVVATLASLKGADENLTGFVLGGLASGWPQGKAPTLSDADKAELAALMKALPEGQRDRLVTLADRWGQRDIFSGDVAAVIDAMRVQVADRKQGDAQRVDAARRLVRLADEADTIALILKQIEPHTTQALADGMILSIAESRRDDAGAAILKAWGNFTGAARRTAVSVLMRRGPWTLSLLSLIEAGRFQRVELTASDWQILKASKDEAVASAATKLDALAANPDRTKVFERMLPALKEKGDINVGKQVFTQLCAQCHIFNGAGGQVGPQLTGIGTRDPKEILAEIVDPNRSLEANFRLWTIVTDEGDGFAGRLDSETQTSVEILDLQGKRHVIQRKNILSMSASGLSIMPVGLIDHLKQEEIASLLEFLRTPAHK